MKKLWFANMGKKQALLLLLALWACSVKELAYAQSIPANNIPRIPQNQTPGAIIQTIQEPGFLDPKLMSPEKPPKPEIKQDFPPILELDSEGGIDGVGNPVFAIKAIELEGVTRLKLKDLREDVEEYENKDNSFMELQGLTRRLTERYQEKGYVTSRVYFPTQTLENDTLILKAQEGHLGKIDITPGRFFKTRVISSRLQVKEGDVLDINPLNQSLGFINQNPDYMVQAQLKAGENSGETDLYLKIEDRLPFHVTPLWDNMGRAAVGLGRLGVTVDHHNLLGMGDSTSSALSWTRRSVGLTQTYSMPVGPYGTQLLFNYSHSRLRLGGDLARFDLRGRATSYSPAIMQPIISKDRVHLSASLGFDIRNSETTIQDEPLFKDQIRSLRPSLTLQTFDRHGKTVLYNELGIGLDVFGATDIGSPLASRTGGSSKFFRYTGQLIRVQKLPLKMQATLRISGQASPDRLISLEQFQVGGAFSIRGYREGVVIGDSGYTVSAEWQMPFFFFPKKWTLPGTRYTLRDNIQLLTFADFGACYTNKPGAGDRRSHYLVGTGVGARINLTRFIVARVDLGIPLLRMAPDLQTPRLHFGLQSRLF